MLSQKGGESDGRGGLMKAQGSRPRGLANLPPMFIRHPTGVHLVSPASQACRGLRKGQVETGGCRWMMRALGWHATAQTRQP